MDRPAAPQMGNVAPMAAPQPQAPAAPPSMPAPAAPSPVVGAAGGGMGGMSPSMPPTIGSPMNPQLAAQIEQMRMLALQRQLMQAMGLANSSFEGGTIHGGVGEGGEGANSGSDSGGQW